MGSLCGCEVYEMRLGLVYAIMGALCNTVYKMRLGLVYAMMGSL